MPLSHEAIAALKASAQFRLANSDYVFPGARLSQPLSNMALLTLARRMKVTGAPFTASDHHFEIGAQRRQTFRPRFATPPSRIRCGTPSRGPIGERDSLIAAGI